MEIDEIILDGNLVRLEPLRSGHLDALCEVALDQSLWRLTTVNVANREDLEKYMWSALEDQKRGSALPFVTIDKSINKIVGSTRFGNIDLNNRRAEIGWTWINPDWQRTYINTEAKYLMLSHAFEVWNFIRVELKTDALNEKSRRAILRIGAKEEGILRNHMITFSGRLRDSVFFSVIESEWKTVKQNLRLQMEKHR